MSFVETLDQSTKGFFMFVCFHLTIFFSSEEDDDDVDITEAELNALPFSDQDDDSDQDIDIEEEDENNDFLSQYAEAGYYSQKKRMDKLFKLKKNRIKQAFFISDISSSSVKAPKQKKNSSFFSLFF